jgi:hypothetical protein
MINVHLPIPLSAVLLAVFLVFTGCDSSNTTNPRTGTYAGPAQTLGDGSVHASVTLEEGVPTSIGVVFTETALSNLPTQPHHGVHETVLALPAEAAVAPYDHVSFDWNPEGHEPPGVYDHPHFDIHFYTITSAERDGINPADTEKVERAPMAEHIPAGYVATPGAVPRMGVHWVDPSSPEFTPAGFSRTFIYGFWDGKMNFLEPMITTAFIESVKASDTQTARFAIPQPQAFEVAGYYPSHYSVSYDDDAKTYTIALDGLERR